LGDFAGGKQRGQGKAGQGGGKTQKKRQELGETVRKKKTTGTKKGEKKIRVTTRSAKKKKENETFWGGGGGAADHKGTGCNGGIVSAGKRGKKKGSRAHGHIRCKLNEEAC